MSEQLNDKVVEQEIKKQPETVEKKINKEVVSADAKKAEENEDPIERNWKLARERLDKEKKEKAALAEAHKKKIEEVEALKAAMEAVLNKPASTNQSQAVDDSDLSEDQKIERKISELLAKQKQEYEQERKERERQEIPVRVEQLHPDFKQIASEENVAYLKVHYPAIYSAFSNQPDSIETWSNIYQTIKQLVPNPASGNAAAKAEKNFNKPQSMSIAGLTPTNDSAPINFDDKRRADNWARMCKIMKSAG